MNLNPEWPILFFLGFLSKISPSVAESLAQRWFDYADRMYYASTSTRMRWRFWFEMTGQGHDARRYERAIYGQRWWETQRHARRRTVAALNALPRCRVNTIGRVDGEWQILIPAHRPDCPGDHQDES